MTTTTTTTGLDTAPPDPSPKPDAVDSSAAVRLPADDALDLQTLARWYRTGDRTPAQVLEAVLARIESSAAAGSNVWIFRLSREQVLDQLRAAEERLQNGASLPLFGVPF